MNPKHYFGADGSEQCLVQHTPARCLHATERSGIRRRARRLLPLLQRTLNHILAVDLAYLADLEGTRSLPLR